MSALRPSAPSSPQLGEARRAVAPPAPRLILNANTPRRLLIPTVRPVRVASTPAPAPRQRQQPPGGTLRKQPKQAAAVDAATGVLPPVAPWLATLGKFEVVQAQTEIEGYQIYAVEQWCALARARGGD